MFINLIFFSEREAERKKKEEKGLDNLQTTLDVIGLIPVEMLLMALMQLYISPVVI